MEFETLAEKPCASGRILLHRAPGVDGAPERIDGLTSPFVALVLVDTTSEEMYPGISAWMRALIESECTAMHAFGIESALVDDLGDWAYIELRDFDSLDDETDFFMTSWHDSREPHDTDYEDRLDEAVFSALSSARSRVTDGKSPVDVLVLQLGEVDLGKRTLKEAIDWEVNGGSHERHLAEEEAKWIAEEETD